MTAAAAFPTVRLTNERQAALVGHFVETCSPVFASTPGIAAASGELAPRLAGERCVPSVCRADAEWPATSRLYASGTISSRASTEITATTTPTVPRTRGRRGRGIDRRGMVIVGIVKAGTLIRGIRSLPPRRGRRDAGVAGWGRGVADIKLPQRGQ